MKYPDIATQIEQLDHELSDEARSDLLEWLEEVQSAEKAETSTQERIGLTEQERERLEELEQRIYDEFNISEEMAELQELNERISERIRQSDTPDSTTQEP